MEPSKFGLSSSDRNFLVISNKEAAGEPESLFLMSIDSGEKRRLTFPAAPFLGDNCPAFSPDERTLPFSRILDGGVSDLYVLGLADGLKPMAEPKRLSFANRAPSSPVWTPDGQDIVFFMGSHIVSEFSGGRGLWRIAASAAGAQSVMPASSL